MTRIYDIFKNHNLHKDPHVSDPATARIVVCEQRRIYSTLWWQATRNKCLHCKRVYDNNVKELGIRPLGGPTDLPHWALTKAVRSGESAY